MNLTFFSWLVCNVGGWPKIGIQNKHILGLWIRSKLHLLVILLFNRAICWKKWRNHAISPWITHFLQGFGDFSTGFIPTHTMCLFHNLCAWYTIWVSIFTESIVFSLFLAFLTLSDLNYPLSPPTFWRVHIS